MSLISRNVVYWFGHAPLEAEHMEFDRRGLSLQIVCSGEIPDFKLARAAVFCAKPPFVPSTSRQLNLVESALSHGLLVYLLAGDDATQAYINGELSDKARAGQLKYLIRSRTGEMPAYECAEVIARHSAGPYANQSLEIRLPPDVVLTSEQSFLLERAFSDCALISLKRLSGGRSADAYVVQATLTASEVGPRPLPFFAKLDDTDKILAEQSCYELYATHHIPWYLRPNLDPRRCILGLEKGILVGSFVEQSESLWEAVLKGRGSRYIHALFEDTLMGWRSQAYRREPVTGLLANRLQEVFKWGKVKSEHVHRAKDFGIVLEPKALWESLLNLPQQKWREAPMHGDMHAENVRVRNNDAIIIDLAKATTGPLCADVASLEVWLAFQVPSNLEDIPERDVWTPMVKDLYAPINVARPPSLATTDVGLDWLRSCVRQTRMISGAICECESEYATVVALYLLRRACYFDGSDEDAYRRAFAYFLGSQLIQSLAITTIETV